MQRKFALYLFLFAVLFGNHSKGAVYQAETAALHKAVAETKNGGFIGDAYVNFDNESGSYLELNIGMAVSGEQEIAIRFANGATGSRPMSVSIDGEAVVEELNFAPTGSWTNWDTIRISVQINEGIRKLRFTSAGSEGGPNLDQFEITGEQLPAYNLNLSVVGDGNILQTPSEGLLFKGQEIVLVARPGWASRFVGWTGDASGSEDTISFILNSDKNIGAEFETIAVELPEPDFSMIGYATVPGEGLETTTGGEGGAVTVIQTLNELKAWGASREDNSTPEIIIIRGMIEAENTEVITIKRGGNISILGDSETGDGYGELQNISINIRDYSNVIVRNMKMHEVFYPDDDLTIDHCHHVWIDHCEFYSKIGTGIGVDTYDGLLDVKKGSHNVTVSWCYFHHHMKTLLIGHSDNNGDQDAELQLTLHHNKFSNTNGRNPSLRFGMCHYFNNYLEDIDDYGFAVRNGAHAKIENCHFESVKLPVATDKFQGHGYACISGCIYSGTCSESDNEISDPVGCDFWDDNISYDYSLEDINSVKLSINLYAGVGIVKTVTSSEEIDAIQRGFDLSSVWYNDGQSSLSFRYNSDAAREVRFSVFSLNGTLISESMQNIAFGSNISTLLVNSIKPGIYILSAETDAGRVAKKVVVK